MRRTQFVAVLAIALLSVGCGQRELTARDAGAEPSSAASSAPAPPPSAGTAVSPAPSVPGPAEGRPRRLRTDADVPAGAPASVPVVTGRTLVRPDGTTVTLPADYAQVVVLAGHVLGVRETGMSPRLDVLDGHSGALLSTERIRGSVVVHGSGRGAAWARPDGDLLVVRAGADGLSRMLRRADGSVLTVRGLTGDLACGPGQDACTVYVEAADGSPAWYVASHGTQDIVGPDVAAVSQARGGLLAGSSRSGCAGVQRTGRWGWLWQDCRARPEALSPGGGLLTLLRPRPDGDGSRALDVVRARTGEPLLRVAAGSGVISGAVWEDAEHLLVSVFDEAHQSRLLRVGLDGAVTAVLPRPGRALGGAVLLVGAMPEPTG